MMKPSDLQILIPGLLINDNNWYAVLVANEV